MKKLPRVYQNIIDKKITNNKEVCYLKNEEERKDDSVLEGNIEATLDQIFSGMGYSYNIPIIISTDKKIYHTSLIAKTNQHVVTLDNDIIMIKDIKKIEFDS